MKFFYSNKFVEILKSYKSNSFYFKGSFGGNGGYGTYYKIGRIQIRIGQCR